MYTTQGYFMKTNNKYVETFSDNLPPEDSDSTRSVSNQGSSNQGVSNQGSSNQGSSNQEAEQAAENLNKIKEQQDMINELTRQINEMANQKINEKASYEKPRNKGPLGSFVDKAYYEKILALLNKEISDNTDLGIVSEKKILNLSIRDIAVLGANQDKLKDPKV